MKTAIDWSAKPEPWSWIGPSLKHEVEAICAGPAAPIRRTQLPDQQAMDILGRRIRAKLSQAELAVLAHCSRSVIARLETGSTSVSEALWRRIDAALAVGGA